MVLARLPESGASVLASEAINHVLDLVGALAEARAEIQHLQRAPRPLLTIAETAEHLRVSTETVRQLVLSGELPKIQLGEQSPRIDPADLDAFIARRRVAQISRAGRRAALPRRRG